MNYFYVYMYTLNGVPLYVGKGQRSRAKQHLEPANVAKSKTFWGKKLRKLLREGLKPSLEYVQLNMLEEEALKLEADLILKYGRKDLKTGILYNTCEGGFGSSGHKMSEEGKRSVSLHMKGKHKGNTFAKGLVHTQETKHKISKSQKGKIVKESTKKLQSEALNWQIEKQIKKAREYIKGLWWADLVSITYEGEVKRQSETSTHRLYNVKLNDIVVKRTITDFRQRSCPKEFKQVKELYV